MRLSHADYRRVNEAIAAMYRVAFTSDPCRAVARALAKVIGGTSNAAILRGSEVLSAARHILERLPRALG